MRAVIQRVTNADVRVDGEVKGKIGVGFLVLLGVGNGDNEDDARYLAEKILNLRIFEDENGKMNISLKDINGEMLVISQFTLYGDCRKGKRPSFDKACEPKRAKELYEFFAEYCRLHNIKTETGVFGADMKVSLVNDGPVTIMLDSRKLF